MYLLERRGEVSQGDVFDDIPFPVVELAEVATVYATVRPVRALLVSHDCEYDKPNNPYVTVAEVRPMAEVDRGSQGNIRSFRVRSTFHLQEHPELPESYVDLRRMASIDKRILADRAAAGKKLVSLSDDARLALQRQIAIFFGVERGP